MDLCSRRRLWLVSAAVVSCCFYEITKQLRQCLKGNNQICLTIGLSTSLHLQLGVALQGLNRVTTIFGYFELYGFYWMHLIIGKTTCSLETV